MSDHQAYTSVQQNTSAAPGYMESSSFFITLLIVISTFLNYMQATSQPLPLLVKEYLVSIFALCIAVYCNGRPGKDISGTTLCDSILHIAKITELEIDELREIWQVLIVQPLRSAPISYSLLFFHVVVALDDLKFYLFSQQAYYSYFVSQSRSLGFWQDIMLTFMRIYIVLLTLMPQN